MIWMVFSEDYDGSLSTGVDQLVAVTTLSVLAMVALQVLIR
jgi:hypothetical protein